jgi:hypothetical protein
LRRLIPLLLVLSGVAFCQSTPQNSSLILTAPAPSIVTGIGASITSGNGGINQYFWWVVATYPIGRSAISNYAQLDNVPNTGSVTIGWNQANGATGYDILRTTNNNIPNPSICNCALVINQSPLLLSYIDTLGLTSSYASANNFAPPARLELDLNNRDYTTPTLTGLPTLTLNTLTIGTTLPSAPSNPCNIATLWTANVKIITPQMCGALANGITDDYTAIMNAHAAAKVNGTCLFFPAATYAFGTAISISTTSTDNTCWKGEANSILKYIGPSGAAWTYIGNDTRVTLDTLTLDGQTTATDGFVINTGDGFILNHVRVTNVSAAAIHIINSVTGVITNPVISKNVIAFTTTPVNGILLTNSFDISIENPKIEGVSGAGISQISPSLTMQVSNGTSESNSIGVYMEGSFNTITGIDIESNSTEDILCNGCAVSDFVGILSGSTTGIVFTGLAGGNTIQGGHYYTISLGSSTYHNFFDHVTTAGSVTPYTDTGMANEYISLYNAYLNTSSTLIQTFNPSTMNVTSSLTVGSVSTAAPFLQILSSGSASPSIFSFFQTAVGEMDIAQNGANLIFAANPIGYTLANIMSAEVFTIGNNTTTAYKPFIMGGTYLTANNGGVIQSTGGAAPTLTAGCNGAGSSVLTGSTNNRGQFTTQTAAATTCTLTFSAAGIWNQAPFCLFADADASITPVAFAAGAITAATAIVDFVSASNKIINYICM